MSETCLTSNDGSRASVGTAISAEGVGFRQPAKSRIRRHQHRLSSVFTRGVLSARGDTTTTGEEPSVTDDPSELSSHITAPGILKVFGTEICEGANYKSVLATTHSSAKELVKEALERYSLNKADADAYVLCDVIGCIREREWRSECVRVVGDNERPLLLQSLWKPKEGYARRFEIQSRVSAEEKISRDKDTVTAGINAQARKLQKTRSRGRSVVFGGSGHGILTDIGLSLCRSLSEADLRSSPEPQQSLKSQSGGEDPKAYKELPCESGRKEELGSSDDNCTQYSIHPPVHFPYFLLLQGYSYRQDFIIYSLNRNCTVFGCNSEAVKEQPAVDVTLWAPDIQPQHCCIQRLQVTTSDPQQDGRKRPGVTILKPFHGALVKRNGAVVNQEVELHSGDVIGLGEAYLFMFKDPNTDILGNSPTGSLSVLPDSPEPHPPTSFPLYQTLMLSTSKGSGTPCAPESTLPCLRDTNGQELVLYFDVEHKAQVLEEIFKQFRDREDLHKLTPSFLMCLCLQQSATHFPMTDLRQLLLHLASEVQVTVLERAKELADIHSQMENIDQVELQPENLLRSLQPLVLWMANSIELLHFIHQSVPSLLHGISRMEEEEEEDCMAVLELRLSTVRPACEEAMTVLEEVIMFTFQQSVYYLTKLLYPVLPSLLDTNPFSGNGQVQISNEVAGVLDIFKKTLNLMKDYRVHPKISRQLFTYLFFFINAFLFNLLMERGSGGSFYHWSCGVQIRANLDVLIDWAYTAGLGELAQNHLHKLSSAVNLLATTREHLLQASWGSLRTEFSSLRPAQLHHVLREYNLHRPCPSAWTPCSADADAACQTGDILENFDEHPPLVLPNDGFQLNLKKPIEDISLIRELVQLQAVIKTFNVGTSTTQCAQCEFPELLEAKCTKTKVLPKALMEQGHAPLMLPKNCDSSTCSSVSGDEGTCEVLLTPKVKALELQDREVNHNGGAKRSMRKSSCLLTPPNTPLSSERMKPETEHQHMKIHHHTCQCCDRTKQEKGGCGRHNEAGDDEVFMVKLLKGPEGLGLSLVDGVETPMKTNGIYVKSVIPGSPAALNQRLRPGDRLLAINGDGLVGLDYHTGRDLIQKAGDLAQLLVARTVRTQEDLTHQCTLTQFWENAKI
ncbi:ras-associating and dilute domain-containing protein isoform X2 [Silurus meridionalis]|uniref:ras-associating and dilute domain-containing protein isoform X2 n=1 Tax=Silurus meridionalis TaxID=175797 RepID=UPI001EEA0569|nr:ras-associating and dilute domain-containing protein isoform X2 [Silurus meridionalis]